MGAMGIGHQELTSIKRQNKVDCKKNIKKGTKGEVSVEAYVTLWWHRLFFCLGGLGYSEFFYIDKNVNKE